MNIKNYTNDDILFILAIGLNLILWVLLLIFFVYESKYYGKTSNVTRFNWFIAFVVSILQYFFFATLPEKISELVGTSSLFVLTLLCFVCKYHF